MERLAVLLNFVPFANMNMNAGANAPGAHALNQINFVNQGWFRFGIQVINLPLKLAG